MTLALLKSLGKVSNSMQLLNNLARSGAKHTWKALQI